MTFANELFNRNISNCITIVQLIVYCCSSACANEFVNCLFCHETLHLTFVIIIHNRTCLLLHWHVIVHLIQVNEWGRFIGLIVLDGFCFVPIFLLIVLNSKYFFVNWLLQTCPISVDKLWFCSLFSISKWSLNFISLYLLIITNVLPYWFSHRVLLILLFNLCDNNSKQHGRHVS